MRLRCGALVAVALVAVAGAASLAWLQSAPGRRFLADAASHLLSTADTTIVVGAIGPGLPGRVEIRDLKLADAGGDLGRADVIVIEWSPLALLRGRLHVKAAIADGVRIERLPTAPGGDRPSAPPRLPRLAVSVDRIEVPGLTIAAAATGQPVRVDLSGTLAASRATGVRAAADARRSDGGDGVAHVTASCPPSLAPCTVNGQLAEGEGGIAATLLGLDPAPPVTATFDGRMDHRLVDIENARIVIPGASLTSAGRIDREAETVDGRLVIAIGGAEPLAAPVATWLGGTTIEAADVDIRARGRFHAPVMALTASIRNLRRPELAIETLAIDAGADPAEGTAVAGGPVALTARATAAGVHWRDPRLAGLLGDRLTLAATGAAELPGGDLTIASADIGGGALHVRGSGRTSLDGGDVDLRLDFRVDDLATVRPLAGQAAATMTIRRSKPDAAFTGHTAIDLSRLATGDADLDRWLQPGLSVAFDHDFVAAERLRVDNLSIRGGQLRGSGAATLSEGLRRLQATLRVDSENITARMEVADLASRPSGDIVVEAATDAGNARVRSRFAVGNGVLRLSDLGGDIAGVALGGALDLPLDGRPMVGRLTGGLRPDRDRATGAPLHIAGQGEITVRLADDRGVQTLAVDASGRGVSAASGGEPGLRFDTVRLTASLRDPFGAPAGDAEVTATGVHGDGFAFKAVEASARGSGGGVTFRARVDGGADTSVQTRGTAAAAQGRTRITFEAIDGTLRTLPVHLRRPARVELSDAAARLDDLEIGVGQGRIAAQGSWADGRAAGRLALTAVPAEALFAAPPWLRTLDGTAEVTTEGQQLGGRFDLRVTSAGAARRRLSSTPPLAATITGRWSDGVIRTEARLRDVGGSDLVATAGVPLVVDARTLRARWPERTPIDGRIRWQGNIADLGELIPGSDTRLKGQGRIALDIGGSLAAPLITGDLSIVDGTYENLTYGTLLRQMSLTGTVDSRGLFVARLAASDGGTGRVSGEARLTREVGDRVGLTADLDLRAARVLNRDDIRAVASGRLDYSRSSSENSLRGRINIDRADIQLVDRLPPTIVVLSATEIGGGRKPPEERPTVARRQQQDTRLDIAVDLPQRVFVRGRGLESEWRGAFRVAHTLAAPEVTGALNLIRGTFIFAGRKFVLNEGTFVFDGGRDIDPMLNIVAEYTGNGLTAIVDVGGRASRPEISLSSRPGLPEDEILPRVLFGRSASQLGPGDAVQLALAVDNLARGDGFGSGLLSDFRGALGLDVLTFDTAASTGDGIVATRTPRGTRDAAAGSAARPAVRIGRNIGESLYVETRQGTRPGTSRYRAEVRITPKLSIESELGDTTTSPQGYLGLKWEHRY